MFDFFGQANPYTDRQASDRVNTAGTLIGDAGSTGGALASVRNMSPGTAGAASGVGFVGGFLNGASELAQGKIGAGLGDLGAAAMSGVGFLNPEMAADVPGLGVAAGAMTAVGHGYEAYQARGEIDKGYQNNNFWTESGNATLGAAGAAASFCPPAALYLGAGQLALDGAGALAGAIGGEKYRFSAGSVVGGAEHLAYDTAQSTYHNATSSVGGGIGAVAGGVMGSVLGPAGTLAGAAGGAWLGNTISGWFGGGDHH